MKKYWRFYRDYVHANGAAETTAVMESLFDQAGPCTEFLRLAVHYALDYGRLPDHMHAALVLTGGEFVSQYLARIDKPEVVG